MTTSTPTTPITTASLILLITGNKVTMHYTTYRPWSGKVYGKGRVSGATASAAKMEVTIGRITDKAYQLVDASNRTCWVPKSKVKVVNDKYVISRGFCYFAGNFPNWQEPRPRLMKTYSPFRRTVI
jgi:hypothetical protein